MSLEADEIQHLLYTVRTHAVCGTYDDGDNWDVPVYNYPQRVEAAEKLASAGATEALSAIQDFFVEYLVQIGVSDDARQSKVRRLAKALITLGGEATFSSMILARVVPVLENNAIDPRSIYGKAHARWEQAKVLSFLRTTFASIGDWEGQVPAAPAEEAYRRAEEAKRLREELEEIRRNLRRKEAQQRAEEARRLAVQRERKSKRQCTMCGKPLGFFHRLVRSEQHDKCRSFTE